MMSDSTGFSAPAQRPMYPGCSSASGAAPLHRPRACPCLELSVQSQIKLTTFGLYIEKKPSKSGLRRVPPQVLDTAQRIIRTTQGQNTQGS